MEIINLATNIWERHRFVKSTIGAMNIEQVSFDNVTSLFYCAVIVFPILVAFEFLFYWLYQTKVIQYTILLSLPWLTLSISVSSMGCNSLWWGDRRLWCRWRRGKWWKWWRARQWSIFGGYWALNNRIPSDSSMISVNYQWSLLFSMIFDMLMFFLIEYIYWM